MKSKIFENVLILLASIVYYLLFWQEKMGLNVLLYSIVMISFLFINKPEIRTYRSVIITAVGTLITAFLVVWNNSLMSKIIHLISFTMMVGFAKQKELRFLGYGLFLYFVSFCETPLKLIQQFGQVQKNQTFRLAPVWRSFRISLIPLLVLLVFYGIYHMANPEFRDISNNFWLSFFDWFSWDISLPQVIFFLSGIIISASILFQSDFPFFKNLQKRHKEKLTRLRGGFPSLFRGMIALKSEFQSGLILLFSLNVLLFIVNILDIRKYWFGNKYILPPYEMKTMVHESTYFLIAGLLLAMIVISYFFRKNLNFYPKNNLLKIAGYAWVVQNGILAISLFIKNYRYIEANDLAYKRIGVLIFLVLVFVGLFTMIIKIKDQKTFYYLLHKNAWVAYAVFIICCFIDWDIFITKYNLTSQTKTEIDFPFLVHKVSDKNIYLLLEQEQQNLLPEQKKVALGYAFQRKINTFLEKQKRLSWLSWNYPDHRNSEFLKTLEQD